MRDKRTPKDVCGEATKYQEVRPFQLTTKMTRNFPVQANKMDGTPACMLELEIPFSKRYFTNFL